MAWLGLLVCLALPAPAAERWQMQFYYDKDQSALDIRAIQCPSAQRCIAAGLMLEKNEREKGVVLLTADGGKKWSMVDVKERPLSLFFLNESLGWMVTDRGVWVTQESGRSWKKLEGLKKGILRVLFLNPSHGYAIGFPKAVYETNDSGKTWSKLAAAERAPGDPRFIAYECITFLGARGVIAGRLMHPDIERAPIWMDPDEAPLRRERRSAYVLLETEDGGKNWAQSTYSLYGDLSEIRISAGDYAVALFEHHEYYSVPSSVFKLTFGAKPMQTIFSERDRAVTDFALLADGGAILASVEPPGSSNQVPIPGKLKMLRSKNLKIWLEMDVDYRAVAQRAVLAAPDARHVWVATDTGMILNLVDTETGSR